MSKKLLVAALLAASCSVVAGGEVDVSCFKFKAVDPDTNQPHLVDAFDMKLVSPNGYSASYKDVRSFKTCVPKTRDRYAAYIKRSDSPAWADGIEFWGSGQPDYKEVALYVR
jgi:hypothetical protein